MSYPIFHIPSDRAGQIYVMPKPDPATLDDQFAHLADLGVHEIVSLMEAEEAAELGLADEPQSCAEHGMAFTSFPIQDFNLPEATGFLDLADRLRHDLRGGRSVAIHCKGGIGRSGMLASLILAPIVGGAEQAISHVSQHRGVDVPDTQKQRDFVIKLTREL